MPRESVEWITGETGREGRGGRRMEGRLARERGKWREGRWKGECRVPRESGVERRTEGGESVSCNNTETNGHTPHGAQHKAHPSKTHPKAATQCIHHKAAPQGRTPMHTPYPIHPKAFTPRHTQTKASTLRHQCKRV